MQSIFTGPHVGIIMDGNGRWATSRGLPRGAGHEAGVRAIGPVVETASEAGVGTLTLYAFSSDNWKRPKPEVALLMRLMRGFLERETASLGGKGVRLSVIGRRDRLETPIVDAIERAEASTAAAARLHLRVAFDYSGRDSILGAASRIGSGGRMEDLDRLVKADGSPDVDLVVRTGGEKRLSDFMIWECAYAELRFVETMWPDFRGTDLVEALRDLASRSRRFGGLARGLAA